MTNFKGTKGKWKLAWNEYGYYTSVRNMDDSRKICVSRVNDFQEQNANMKLISKAPEMLEMLEECLTCFKAINSDSIMCEKIKELIKEATEL